MRCRRERGVVTAAPLLTLRDTRIFKTGGERRQRIRTVRGPIVQWIGSPYPLLVFPLIAIVFQAIQTAFAAVRINPGPIEHATDRIDAIELVVSRDNLRPPEIAMSQYAT